MKKKCRHQLHCNVDIGEPLGKRCRHRPPWDSCVWFQGYEAQRREEVACLEEYNRLEAMIEAVRA